ncbi:hypothetical protein SLEP1_g399 [Rubroshorea leprosula]|uniref:Uncharacterized protein n=1 Tax=Rubroshorea leprosula TaxID=152421 RepID=A0AAV5HJR7_9ROSI|nr:hypothetical protein SLEP1_g399 [Rubroshorea leprosula]
MIAIKQGKCWPGLPGWPQGIFASKVVLDKEKQVATVDREVDSGPETVFGLACCNHINLVLSLWH